MRSNSRKNTTPKVKLLKNQKLVKIGAGNKGTQNKKTKVEENRVGKTKKRKSDDVSLAKAKKIKRNNVIIAKKNIKKKPPEKMEKKPPAKKPPAKKCEKKYDDDSPPTLCETFSRIQSIVAETVISEKAEKKLLAAAGIKPFVVAKVEKKKKPETPKKSTVGIKKPPIKKDLKKPSPTKAAAMAKVIEKEKEDKSEELVRILNTEECSEIVGKGIASRRKSVSTSPERDRPGKGGNKCKDEKIEKKGKGKVNKMANRPKKNEVEENEKCKKKVVKKAEKVETKTGKKQKGKQTVREVKKQGTKSNPKIKVGSETDGSNSDELTLNVLAKKKPKVKKEEEVQNRKIKSEPEELKEVKIKVEKVDVKDKKKRKIKLVENKRKQSSSDDMVLKKVREELLADKSNDDSDSDLDSSKKKKLALKLGRKSNSKLGENLKQRRLKLFGFWSGPKRHRVASLNAIAKVHCLYENESKVLGEVDKVEDDQKKGESKDVKKLSVNKKLVVVKKAEKELDFERLESVVINKRTLRGAPGMRGAGKHWDMCNAESTTSTSSVSSDESHSDTEGTKGKKLPLQPSYRQKMQKKEESSKANSPPKRRRNLDMSVKMDLKDMVVRKRMASLNASAILAASYSSEKRSCRKESGSSTGTSTEDGVSSPEEDKSDGTASSDTNKKPETNNDDKFKRRKNFWKTKLENLKNSKDKRNSPSPILADFSIERSSEKVLEKEKKDELKKKKVEGKKCIHEEKKGTKKSKKGENMDEKKGKSNRKDKKNVPSSPDEYEYKSDSDNGQRKLIELRNAGGSNKKVAVIVNQDTDVTITGVYVNSTRSTHHEGYCNIAGMQYRISSTSHTQTEATAVATEVLKTSTPTEQPPSTVEENDQATHNQRPYTPLAALSNMQPPGGRPHSHLPPPVPPPPPPPPPQPHHHHHHCNMIPHRPPPHYMGQGGPPQGPISPLGRRHGCSSAFSAPPNQQPPGSPPRDPDAHGYYQPAGPLIHNPPSASVKGQNASIEAAADSRAAERPCDDSTRPPPPTEGQPSASHSIPYTRGYPSYQPGYYQGGYYPPPPQSAHYQPPPPPSFHQHYHHHQDLCYPPGYPPSSYPPPPGPYRRFLPPPPHGYYTPELSYSSPGPQPPAQEHSSQQMVVPGSASSSYPAPLDPYPPPAPYYPGYTPGPGPGCYSPSRNLSFIEPTYQSCPCPMQSCPKNVHIGPLTGECKRPGALPLPPVALQLPQEPPGAAGPPSPARGSAGMPPLPSPARPNHGEPSPQSCKLTTETKESENVQKTRQEWLPQHATGLLVISHQPSTKGNIKAELESPPSEQTKSCKRKLEEPKSKKKQIKLESEVPVVSNSASVSSLKRKSVEDSENQKNENESECDVKKIKKCENPKEKLLKDSTPIPPTIEKVVKNVKELKSRKLSDCGNIVKIDTGNKISQNKQKIKKCKSPLRQVNVKTIKNENNTKRKKDVIQKEHSMIENRLKPRLKCIELNKNNVIINKRKTAGEKKLAPISKCVAPKWSNGWSWEGPPFEGRIFLTNDEAPVMRKCYPAMRHSEGDIIHPKDCILLKAGPRKTDLPFVAKVASLWENPEDGEMMVSLLWYYRPEHTEQGRKPNDQSDEIFASRHKDINSVACIEDKCYVLTFNEYCRYRKAIRGIEQNVRDGNSTIIVPCQDRTYPRRHRQPPFTAAPELVFFCRKVYDFRQKRILKNPS